MRKHLLLALSAFVASPVFAEVSYTEYVTQTQAVMSVTVLVLVAVVGSMALHWIYRNRYQKSGGKAPFLVYAWQNTLVRLILFVTLVVVAVNVVSPGPKQDETWQDVAATAKSRRMSRMATLAYKNLCRIHPDSVNYHFEYITAYYEQEVWAYETGEADIYEEDDNEDPKRYYLRLANDPSPRIQDIAKLGLGICCYYVGPASFALEQFESIQDSTLPYQYLYKGRIHASWNEIDAAKKCFWQEISLGRQRERAVQDWALTLYAHEPDSLEKMAALVADPELGGYVPSLVQRYLHHQNGAIGDYFRLMVADWWTHSQWIGLIGGLLGALLWLVFLRRIDAGRHGNGLLTLVSFAGGAIFSFLALYLYDTVHFDLGIEFRGDSFLQDFAYCVFGIGVIEELVKILPFLLVISLLGADRRPIHYILYAGASALGFAFVENLMYFDAGHVGIMHGRILVTVVFHMFATTTIAFAMLLGKYRYRKWRVPLFLAGFLAASFFHGFFDFWLMSPSVRPFIVITYAFFGYITFQYAAYLNNAMNHTALPKGLRALDPGRLAIFLTVGLVGILLFEYSSLGIVYGRQYANYSLLHSLGMGSFMMFFVVLNLSNIDVVPGEWMWLRLWDFGSRKHLNALIGTRLELVVKNPSGVLAAHFPMSGMVISRISLHSSNPYYLLQLDRPIEVQGVPLEQLLLRGKIDGEIPEPGQNSEVIVVAFRDQDSLKRAVRRKSDFKMLDVALVR